MSAVALVAMLCSFGLGACFSLLGSISVKLMPRTQIDAGKFGTLISIFMFSCLIFSFVMGILTAVIGYMWIAVLGFVSIAVCIFILAAGKNFGAVMIPCVLLGIGAMSVNVVANTMGPGVLFEGENPAAASNLINIFFGLGLFLTPLVVSFLFRKTSYEKAVGAMGVILLLPLILVVMSKGEYPAAGENIEIASVGQFFSALVNATGAAVKLLAEPAVLVAAFVLFCYIALESSFCNWLPSFGKEVLKKEKESVEEDIADAKEDVGGECEIWLSCHATSFF